MSRRSGELRANARLAAERLRRSEAERGRPPLNFADPDARESITSSARAYWPPDVLLKFARARVITFPRVRLYDELPPDVTPARPRK